MKATADDENPCPGYLFQEIGSILGHQMLFSRLHRDQLKQTGRLKR